MAIIFALFAGSTMSAKTFLSDVNTFLSSDTYQRHKNFIDQHGKLDVNNTLHQKVNVNEQDYDLYIIPVINQNNAIVGKLEVIDLKGTNFLPNKDKFALNYADLSRYDLRTHTGSIILTDLNYDNFVHSQITIDRGTYTKYESKGLSEELKTKYDSVANRRAPKNVSCDGNGNGNVSYSECYRCISVAIEMSSTSSAICGIYESSGLPWWGGCNISTAAACVIISSIY